MGTLTLGQLNLEVRAGLGNRVDPKLTDDRITAALNLAQQRVGRFYNWQDTNQVLTTQGILTNNQAVDKWLALPPNVKVIHSLVLQDGANSRKITEKPWRMFDESVPLVEFDPPDWPTFYTRFGFRVIMLYPTPLQTFLYFLRATMFPTPFVTNQSSTVSDFIDKDDILIEFATAYFHRQLGRPDLADSMEAEAVRRMQEAQASAEDRPDMNYSSDDLPDTGAGAGPYWLNPFVQNEP